MSENEAIKNINALNAVCWDKDFYDEEFAKAMAKAVKALHEIQQYRAIGTISEIIGQQYELQTYQAIGTVEECRTAYGRGYNQGTIDRAEEIQKAREYGYAKAIDEFADAIKNTLPIAVHRDCSEIDYEIDYALYNMRHKIDKIAEELKEGAE